MRKQLFPAAIAAFLLAGAPAIVFAQETPATPQENLDCAVWAAALVANVSDPAAKTGIGYAMSWFIGLYEGQTGQNIDTALAARSRAITEEEFEAIHEPCLARMTEFGERLQAAGDAMQQTPAE